MPAITLGIETSGRSGRIALRVDTKTVDERELSQTGRRHAQTLLLELQELLTDHSLAPRDIDLVAASQGPGSFTGLRVGVVCAKTLAWANDCRLAMVDTLLAIAAEAPPDVTRVEVVSDAQRDELFLGRYERVGSAESDLSLWQRSSSIEIVNSEAWALQLAEQTDDHFAICGPGLPKAVEFLPSGIRQVDRPAAEPSAATTAQLGEQLAADGQLSDPMTVEPFYLRKSAAEEKREAAQKE